MGNIGGDRVASLEPKRWARQAWNYGRRKETTMGKQNKALMEEVGLDGARVLIGLGT